MPSAVLPLLLALSVSAVEVDAVVVTRKSGLTPAQTVELQQRLNHGLEDGGLWVRLAGPALQAALKQLGVKDSSACNGRRSCVQELATQLQAPVLISVSITRVAGETAVALELVRAGEAQSTVKDSFIVPAGKPPLGPLTAAFAAKVRDTLAPPPPVKVEAPPVVPAPSLLPENPPPPPLLVVPSPPPAAPSRAAPITLGALGGVSLAAGVALLVVGAVARGTVQGGEQVGPYRGSLLDDATATRINTEANVATGAGIGAAALGAGLLTGAILTW